MTMNGRVRKRAVADDSFEDGRKIDERYITTDEEKDRKWSIQDVEEGSSMLGWLHWLILGAYVACVIYLVQTVSEQLPKPWPSSTHGDLRDLSRFSEDRAMQHLLVLTSFRPRTVGTDGNDKFAANYFFKEAQAIKRKAQPVHEIEIDHQIVSGSFRLAFLGGE